ncbi:hypothetical protein ACQ4PT_029203 [Festuca glaucescens]
MEASLAMTVGGLSGDVGGDHAAGVDLATQALPKTPEKFTGSRFWVLQADDEEDTDLEDGEEEEGGDDGSPAGGGDRSATYLCRTPVPVRDADLVEASSELNRRQMKRLRRRDEQRMAARSALFFSTREGMNTPPSVPLGIQTKSAVAKNPVLEPSVFVDESMDGWTVVRRRRWSPAFDDNLQDPKMMDNSNLRAAGQAGLRALVNNTLRSSGPNQSRQGRSVDQSGDLRGPRIAKVGNNTAGFAFRRFLGLAWKKFEAAAPVVRRRRVEVVMNGDGGRGGFNPGRGAFNRGRGGFGGGRGDFGTGGGRGDYANGGGRGVYGNGGGRGGGHGGYGADRGGYGADRGGYGHPRGGFAQRGRHQGPGRGNAGNGAGRGYQQNSFGGFGGNRNFVQGESSTSAGSDFNGNWGSANGANQRGGNFISNNNSYGGNHQRWNSGRGGSYVNRNRGQESEGAMRSGIDADLLQQTVQAVVAAVTAATKVTEAPVVHVPVVTAGHDPGPASVDGQSGEAPAAMPNPTVVQQEGVAQSLPDGSEMIATDKENEVQGASKKKKEDKAGCFRCKKPGHYIDDCPTPYCDICESIHHVTSACHLLNAPKPTAILHGYANEALMFFELACGVFKPKAVNPKLAKVTVEGDILTIPEIIEQLKKIVPSEKFIWEVFHLKENIYRVKLPSKLEVQRLKNFGTYICTDRESRLTFDAWSSVEEPLYRLQEVWVRVSGLPSDVRSDYLALWGVGTLFGKTLEVDMAYTRKNKVLRTKIGCLDHRLIPADSDMFIRRGFYKLRFEVELEDKLQEVNMVDAEDDFDGDNGANQGEGKKGNDHDIDMDNKENDLAEGSKDNDHDGSSKHNGVDGMQEQCAFLEAIRFGSMDVKLASPGNLYAAKNSDQNDFVFPHISPVQIPALDDNFFAESHADFPLRGAASGSVGVRKDSAGRRPVIGQQLPDAVLAQYAANEQTLHAGRQAPPEPAVSAAVPHAAGHAAAAR